MNKRVLITGGDGYVGLKVALLYLQNTEHSVSLLVRSSGQEELSQKIQRIKSIIPEMYLSRYDVKACDVSKDNCFDDIETEGVEFILHTAAVIRFNVEEEVANNVNRDGTRRTLEFAKTCSDLKSFDYLSTIYATGDITGVVKEQVYSSDLNFINHYERSKSEAENIILNEFEDIPFRIIRIATVLSDDQSGHVTQYNVFHNTMRLLYNGLISLLPGDEHIPIYLITGDFAANSIFEIMQSGNLSQVYHVCHSKEESATLGDLIRWTFEVFEENEDFKQRRILKPLFADEKTFFILANSMKSLSQGILKDALESMTPFAKQLYLEKDFKNSNFKKSTSELSDGDVEKLIKKTGRYLIKTKWGRVVES